MRALLLALVVLAALAPTARAESRISVEDQAFAPSQASAAAWETVSWTWRGAQPHGVVGDDGEVWCETRTEGRCERTFARSGEYRYHCPVHPAMTGVVLVDVSGGDAAAPLRAIFTVEVEDLEARVDASASAASSTAIETFAWTWGDGNASLGRVATHAYAVAGLYTIQLEVTDENGEKARSAREVRLPAEDRGAFAMDADGRTLTAEAPPTPNATRVIWDLGDGTRIECQGEACVGASAATIAVSPTRVVHEYLRGGTFEVKRIATLANGTSEGSRQIVHVDHDTSFLLAQSGLRVFVDASHLPTYGDATYEWRFSDATNATGAIADHAFSREGIWEIVLRVEDEAGESFLERDVTLVDQATARAVTSAPATPTARVETPLPALALVVAAALVALAVAGSKRYK